MDLTIAHATAITPARPPGRAVAAGSTGASSTPRQPATDVVDLRSGSGVGSSVMLRVTVGGSVRTYTYNSFA